jgi:photosystem II stability/assembly factor-like uncharacterized protein
MTRRIALAAGISVTTVLVSLSPGSAQSPVPITTDQLRAFAPRSIGPAVTGGRVHDIEALPDDPSTIFVASASGGLWKTTNRGHTWRNVFDDMPVSTFGDVAISASDPNVVYAGTGEQNNRQSTSWGNGVYRSDDGGETWRHLGLDETRHIGKVEVDPTDPDVVFVAALGNLWKDSEERGVFRSRDGGNTWEKVLYVDSFTGAVDMVMDPTDPNTLYAATYQRLRRTWGFNGGGAGSGIHKTTDGGDTWRELTEGVPEGDKGRIGLAIARTNARVLSALIQHASESGTYRSEDAGETWTKVNDQNGRPMYYSEIFIDPSNENRVYTLATTSHKSEDGGSTFEVIAERPSYDVGVHADHHALWIDPNDPNHLYLGGDAGLHESYDMGVSFRKLNNFPISQFYAIGVDMRDPYWVYGGLQDNHSFMGPSRTRRWAGIVNDDWKQIGFGDGMYWQLDPSEPRYAYGNAQNGSYTRVDTETGDILDIAPAPPPGEDEYRWDWVSPSLVSVHDPSTVYVGGNRLFISRDRGVSWERTEDLTRAIDRDNLELMGVKGADMTLSPNDGTSSFGEITTIAESPLDARILWVGTDDGNLQVSRDGGRSWTPVHGTVGGVADGTYVSRVVASRTAPGAAYAAFDAHRDGDFSPYVYRTSDFGESWRSLAATLPSGSANSLVEHPDNPSVLFLGTEHHLFASTDAGVTWAQMPTLPTTHYDDLVVHPRDRDLVIGTHGRGIWILDDVVPLARWSRSVAEAAAHLFPVRPATLFHYWKDTSYRGNAEFAGENPVDGAIVTYSLGAGAGDARITVAAADGMVVREMTVPDEATIHRINWDLRHGLPDAELQWAPHEDPRLARSTDERGPFVTPGTYTISLEARGTTVTETVEVLADPELPVTLAQYREREAFLLRVLALQSQASTARLAMAGLAGGPELEQLEDVDDILEQVYEEIDGSGVRPGTLYPPTDTQRQRVDAAEATLAELAPDIPEP